MHLNASHAPTGRVYWEKELHWLDPGVTAGGWTVEVGRPLEEAADSLLKSIRSYGLPAMQAAMDSPGYPPDPQAEWPRAFPPPGGQVADGPPDLGEIAWILRPLGQEADQWLPMLASASADDRIEALHKVSSLEDTDPRCRTALLERQVNDPSRRVRRYLADLLKLPLNEDESDRPPGLDRIAWVLRPTGQPADEWFARLSRERDASRMGALRNITRDAADDTRTLPVLLDRLEHDPSPHLRSKVTELLTPYAQSATVQQALYDAGAPIAASDRRRLSPSPPAKTSSPSAVT